MAMTGYPSADNQRVFDTVFFALPLVYVDRI